MSLHGGAFASMQFGDVGVAHAGHEYIHPLGSYNDTLSDLLEKVPLLFLSGLEMVGGCKNM